MGQLPLLCANCGYEFINGKCDCAIPMTNNTATPRPWRYKQETEHAGCDIYGEEKNGYICTTSGRAKANAQLIVKCCNNYDNVIKLLKQILNDGGINDITAERIREIISKD